MAVCHTLRPRGPLDTCLRPRGDDRPRQLVCFGEVQAETGRIWGCGAGGMGLQMGRCRQAGGRGERVGLGGGVVGFCEKNY